MTRRVATVFLLVLCACVSRAEREKLRQAQILVSRRQYGAAIAALESFKDVRRLPVQYTLALAYLGRNQFPEAAYRFGIVTSLNPAYRDSVSAHYRRKAQNLARIQDRMRALYCLSQAQALTPDLGEDFFLLADLYQQNGEYGLAAASYEQGLLAAPGSRSRRDAYEDLINCYRQLGDLRQALATAQRALGERFYDLSILYGEIAYAAAQEFFRQGELDSAQAALQRTLEVQRPTMLLDDAYFLLGEVRFQQGDYAAAETAYGNVKRVDPYERSPLIRRAEERLAVIARMKTK